MLKQLLPNGSVMIAEVWNDPEYPGIRIYLQNTDGTPGDCLCFAEYNTARITGRELCVCAYSRDMDEPTYYESYNDSVTMSPNV
jgi:hypothetical protein